MKERCEANGYPVPKITWLQNGKQMSLCLKNNSNSCLGQNYQVMEESNEERASSQSALIIVRTMYPRDQGNYTCVAESREGSDQKTMNIFVHSKFSAHLFSVYMVWYTCIPVQYVPGNSHTLQWQKRV